MPDLTFRVRDAAGQTAVLPVTCTVTSPPPAGSIAPGQSWQTAYNAAAAGSVLTVLAGNHGSPVVTGTKAVTFRGSGVVVVASLPGGAANATFENMTVDTGGAHGWRHVELNAANITWKNIDVKGQYASVWVNGATNFRWLGGTFFGPPDQTKGRVNPGDGEPLTLDANVVTIDGVTFGKFKADYTSDFHLEDIRVQGSDDITVKNCVFTNGSDAGSGHIFITDTQPSTTSNKRLRLENNVFPPVIGSFTIQIHANVQRYDSWVIRGNRFDQPILDGGQYVNLTACGNTGQVPAAWKAAC